MWWNHQLLPMEFRWEVGKWRNQPLRRPQQFEDSTFLWHISRTWTLALPACFSVEPLGFSTPTGNRGESKRKPQSPCGDTASHFLLLLEINLWSKESKESPVLSKARNLLNLTWIFMPTILAPATHCWCLPSNSMCPQGTESTCQWRQRLSWYFLQCPSCDTHQMPLKSLQVHKVQICQDDTPLQQSCCSNNQVDTFGRPAMAARVGWRTTGLLTALAPQERWHPLGYSRYHWGSGCIALCCSARVGHSKCQLHLKDSREETSNFGSCFGYQENRI